MLMFIWHLLVSIERLLQVMKAYFEIAIVIDRHDLIMVLLLKSKRVTRITRIHHPPHALACYSC